MAFAYSIVAIKEGDKFTPHARVECAKCGAHTRKRLAKTNLPPEVVAKFLKRAGWEIDPYKPASVRCPDCQKSPNAKGEKPNKESTRMSVSTLNTPSRELTAEERQRVRTLLDSQFDDSKGIYLEGYSDQRIGTEANVPWSSVRKMREAAYGPLKSVPELDALLADQRALSDKVAEAVKNAATLQGQANDLAKRIANIGAKMGVAA